MTAHLNILVLKIQNFNAKLAARKFCNFKNIKQKFKACHVGVMSQRKKYDHL